MRWTTGPLPVYLEAMRGGFDGKRLHFIAGRTNTFLFCWSLVLLVLFILSNYQGFLDSDQRLIMDLLAAALVLNLATGLFYLVFPALLKDPSLRPRPRRTAFLVVSLCFSLLLFLVIEFFYTWISF